MDHSQVGAEEASEQVLIVGAGAAGMAAAASLRKHGIDPLLLEREEEIGMSWARRYDSLRLNTPRLTSSLAGYRMPRRYGRWPKRDDIVEYLRDYARRLGLRVRTGAEVTRIDPQDGGWVARDAEGEWEARCIVVTTGHDRYPAVPEWRGREGFSGRLLHSSEYREPSPFRDQDVLVVSARNSGTEIALELARGGAARVWTSMRTPPNVFPREWLNWPLNYSAVSLEPFGDRVGDVAGALTQRMIYGDLSRWGIGTPPVGVQTMTRRRHRSVLVDAGYIEALKRGEVEIVPAVEAFEGDEVVLADGSRLRPDAVIAATGFRSGLEELVGHLGVLGEDGYPLVRRTDMPNALGLFFNGFYASMAGQLIHMRSDARHIARAIARRLSGDRVAVRSPVRVPRPA